ncbi:hypothetical protein AB837_00378 [bacterium AB1]|nr:hypothetical protein AB837_00378 [bacterium AB1]
MIYKQLRPFKKQILSDYISILNSKFQDYILEDNNSVLDICAGTGSFSIYFEKYFYIKNLYLVEKSSSMCGVLERKLSSIFLEKKDIVYKVICADARNLVLKNLYFNIVILDPPYQYCLAEKIIKNLIKQNIVDNKTLFILRKQPNSNKNNINNILNTINILHITNNVSETIFFTIK